MKELIINIAKTAYEEALAETKTIKLREYDSWGLFDIDNKTIDEVKNLMVEHNIPTTAKLSTFYDEGPVLYWEEEGPMLKKDVEDYIYSKFSVLIDKHLLKNNLILVKRFGKDCDGGYGNCNLYDLFKELREEGFCDVLKEEKFCNLLLEFWVDYLNVPLIQSKL